MIDSQEQTAVRSEHSFIQILYVARDTPVKPLAGSVAHALRQDGSVAVQAIGASAVNQMVKSLATARKYMLEEGKNLVAYPEMVDVEIGGARKTAIRLVIMATCSGMFPVAEEAKA